MIQIKCDGCSNVMTKRASKQVVNKVWTTPNGTRIEVTAVGTGPTEDSDICEVCVLQALTKGEKVQAAVSEGD